MKESTLEKSMNNGALVITARNRDEAIEMASEGTAVTEPASAVVRSLRFLKDNVHFKTYTRRVIDAEIASERRKLEKEQDPVKMYRLQGYIAALEKMKDLDKLQKNYQAKVDRNKNG